MAECTDRKELPKVFAQKILSCLREEETKRKIKAAVYWPCALAAPDWAKKRNGNRKRVLEAQSPVVCSAVMHPAKPLFVLCLVVNHRRKLFETRRRCGRLDYGQDSDAMLRRIPCSLQWAVSIQGSASTQPKPNTIVWVHKTEVAATFLVTAVLDKLILGTDQRGKKRGGF